MAWSSWRDAVFNASDPDPSGLGGGTLPAGEKFRPVLQPGKGQDGYTEHPPSKQEQLHPGREVTPDPPAMQPQYHDPHWDEPHTPAWAQGDSGDPFHRTPAMEGPTPAGGTVGVSLTPRTHEERNR